MCKASSFWAHPHEGLPVTLGDQRALLLEGFVMEFADAGARAAICMRVLLTTCVVQCTVSPSNKRIWEISHRSCRDWQWWGQP